MFLNITVFWDEKLCISVVGTDVSKEPAASFFKTAILTGRTRHHDNLPNNVPSKLRECAAAQ
jgi:hypothetical protein